MERPSDDSLRRAQSTMRSLVSDGSSRLPALSVVADTIRLELERRGRVAILYVKLDRYAYAPPLGGAGRVLAAGGVALIGIVLNVNRSGRGDDVAVAVQSAIVLST